MDRIRTPEWAWPLRWTALHVVVGLVVALAQGGDGQAAFYPPVAIGVALLLAHGRHWWPAVLAAELLVAFVQYGGDAVGGTISAVVTTGEVLVAAVLLDRLRFRWTLQRLEDVTILGGVAILTAVLGASVGTLLLEITDAAVTDPGRQWVLWSMGEATGLALCLPVLQLLADPDRAARRISVTSRRHLVELLVATASAGVLVTTFLVLVPPGEVTAQELGPLLVGLLPLMWIAIRFGVALTSLAVVALDLIALVAYGDLGPHAGVDQTAIAVPLGSVELAVLVFGLAALAVAAAVESEQAAITKEQAIRDASPLAIVALDTNGRVLSWNAAAERTFGWTADEAHGRAMPAVPPEGRLDFVGRLQRAMSGSFETTTTYRRADGTDLTGHLFTAPLRDVSGAVTGVVGIIEDVTESQEREARMALLTAAIDQAGEAIIVSDAQSNVLYVNPAAERTSGYTRAELMTRRARVLRGDVDPVDDADDMARALMSGRTWSGVLPNRRKNGEIYEEHCTITPVTGDDGVPVAFVTIKLDLSRERALQHDLQRSLDERATIAAIMDRVSADGTETGVAGQICAAMVASTDFDAVAIVRVRPDGSVLPVGLHGAELPGYTIGRPLTGSWLTELVRITDQSPWWLDWSSPPTVAATPAAVLAADGFTASAQVPIRSGDELTGVLMAASRAPDATAWIGGRLPMLIELAAFTGTVLRSAGPHADDDALREGIAGVIDRHELSIVFQPVVDLSNGQVSGYEALTRFDDGTPPDRRFEAAWAVGLGPDLERATARLAISEAMALPRQTVLHLNMSPELIVSGAAAEILGVAHRPMVLEVTEHVPIGDYARLRAALDTLPGVRVAVDDAGAGYASLRHILELQPDVVKLDIGLVRGIDTDPARQAIVAGLVHYAQTARIVLVGEGVETAGEADTLRHLGVGLAQGYLFGRPAPL